MLLVTMLIKLLAGMSIILKTEKYNRFGPQLAVMITVNKTIINDAREVCRFFDVIISSSVATVPEALLTAPKKTTKLRTIFDYGAQEKLSKLL